MIELMSYIVDLLVVMAGLSIIPAFMWASRRVPTEHHYEDPQEQIQRRIDELERRADRSFWQ